MTITEADTSSDSGPFADPGYQKDKQKRYPLDSKSRAKAAWSYIHQADNARLYTSAQLKRIKQRIVKALKGYGVTVAATEGWLIDPATAVTEALAECWDMDRPAGDLYVSLTNGPTTVTVTSRLLDPHDLDAVGRAAMAGACNALLALDPDMDADIDVPGAEPEDTDHGMDDGERPECVPGAPCPCGCGCAVPAVPGGCPCGCQAGDCVYCAGPADEDDDSADDAAMETTPTPETPAPETAAATTEKEAPMAESTTPAAGTPAAADNAGIDALSAKLDKLSDALAGFVTAMTPKAAPVEAAPAAPEPVAEAAPVAESDDERIARLVAEGIAKALPQAVQEHVETTGGPARKGLVNPVTEHTAKAGDAGLPEGWPQKPLHDYSQEEWSRYVAPNTVGAILGARGALPAE